MIRVKHMLKAKRLRDACENARVDFLPTYYPKRFRLIPNDGSVVVLEREDVEWSLGFAEDEMAHRDHRFQETLSPEDGDELQVMEEHVARLRSALEQAPAKAEGESDE